MENLNRTTPILALLHDNIDRQIAEPIINCLITLSIVA
jgi:hypothetical protein